jgi:hypothetical protein
MRSSRWTSSSGCAARRAPAFKLDSRRPGGTRSRPSVATSRSFVIDSLRARSPGQVYHVSGFCSPNSDFAPRFLRTPPCDDLASSRVRRPSDPEKTTVLPALVEATPAIGSGGTCSSSASRTSSLSFPAKKSAMVSATTSPNPSILSISARASEPSNAACAALPRAAMKRLRLGSFNPAGRARGEETQ